MTAPVTADSHVYLVDGSGFIFRAFHALPPLTRKSDGLPVGAISGFCNMLYKLIEDATDDDGVGPTHMGVIFDASSITFRNEIYPEYKAHRPEPPEDLRPQFPIIRDAVRAFSVACIELEGYEADDLIAAYTRQAEEAGARVTIVSSDKDLMQLVSDRVEMFDGMKNAPIREPEVRKKFMLGPEHVVDIQALAGDSVDNVPGAPGIGIKTAAQLIEQFGDLETLLERAGEIKQPKRRQTLIDHAEQIRVSKRLVQLDADAPVPEPIEALGVQPPDAERLITFLREMEFTTLTRRVANKFDATIPEAPAAEAASEPEPPTAIETDRYEIVRDEAALTRWIEAATARGYVAVDTETTSLDEMRAEIVGVSLCIEPGKACYIPLAHTTGDGDLLGQSERAEGQMDREAALALLKPLFEDAAVLKIGQNLKYDMKVLARRDIGLSPIDDTMLMSYAQDAGLHPHGMDALSAHWLDHQPIPIKTLLGTGKSQITFDKVPIDKAAPYAAEDADITLRLWQRLRPRLVTERVTTVYETLERPLVPVLASMEREGIKVDRAALSRISGTLAQRMAALEADIHALAGHPFNVGSPKQLGDILFGEMGLPGGKKTRTGAWSTSAQALEDLAATHDLPARVLDWRQLSKLKSTYADALVEHINPETGRVHTSFSLASTTTGRLSSTDPNLQNIPVRTEEGREIRKAFVAEEGHRLISLDYSQIELRLLAHIADIETLRQAFRDGQDIHAMTASAVFGVPVEGMDPMVRRQAKAINFGVIYGISAHGLSNQLRIPRGEAQAFIDAYFERFPGIRDYMDRTIAGARERGYVETPFGRRVHTPDINAKGPMRGYQERAAINAPIQGGAADIIRRAMVRIPGALREAGIPARMLLQVHDELIFEAPEDAAEDTAALARGVMEAACEPAVSLSVPLVVDSGIAENWAGAH